MSAGNIAVAQPGADEDAPRISLLTFAPGEIYWQRFGHNALLVRDADGRDARVYNYGIFDFQQKNFFLNFARGRMLYRVDETPLIATLNQYAAEGRWVIEQELALDPAQRRALTAFLATNALPQNAEYRYDYFVSNCSTRVRDALDQALGGQIKAQLQNKPAPISYRAEVLQLMAPEPTLMFGMDLGLGAVVDAPLDQWQDGFIPMRLMAALREVNINPGQPDQRRLVQIERELVRVPGITPEAGGPIVPEVPPVKTFLLAGLSWALVLVLSAWLMRRSLFAALATGQVLLAGLGGLVLLLGWFATDHWGMARNLNLLLLNPLWWLLLPAVLAQFGRRPRARAATGIWVLGLFALASLPGLYLSEQNNAHSIAVLLPAQLTLLLLLFRRNQGARRSGSGF
ncbi:MAG: DUF4105 domain-containing protein [Pseudomonadota bacterium]|nr:DUF4105 domain-containing protein [Pseudomonadota bacterium]